VAFEVKGGQQEAWKAIDGTQLLSITANLGDTKTTITHPATTTHAKLTEDEKSAAGITPNLLRIAAGLEHIDDLQADLEQSLKAI
jgi:O-succinylhomoserine sulfhydrylase